ncbi:MAG: hypothetical protein DRP03_03710 [Candidatus Aenigmatarchaeota archaeon]|nr:MAG: hypothetical protein DRP03_03710 [Candidatus Aenigmarchaeota archaeon]
MFFVGIDLAWSERNKTGIAILKGNKSKAHFYCSKNVLSNKEIVDFIKEKIGNRNAFIAIDAPLIVPNEHGNRNAEKLIGRLFKKYKLVAYPVNRKIMSQYSGGVRGEELSKLFEKAGFKHDPYIKRFESERKFFEVFTHASMIVIFKLSGILPYKSKPKRGYELRWKAFKQYQLYLKSLSTKHPYLFLPKGITEKDVKKLKAGMLKEYENMLDAILCAYTAYYCWQNPDRCAVLGNMKEGYILTPVFSYMKKRVLR